MVAITKATYNITDDKLKVWFDERLPDPMYQQMKRVGFTFWPGRKCFAVKWNLYAEDLILELGGNVEDDDTPDDMESRVERFTNRADRETNAASAAKEYLDERANTERRKENALNRVKNSIDKAAHWLRRVEGAVRHAAMKADPGVIYRRIKGLEKEHRKATKELSINETFLKLWTKPELSHEKALALSRILRMSPSVEGHPNSSAWSLLNDRTVPTQVVVDAVIAKLNLLINQDRRIVEHVGNRIIYEQASLDAAGPLPGIKTPASQTTVEVGGAAQCGRNQNKWATILKVLAKSVRIEAIKHHSAMQVPKNGFLVSRDRLVGVMTKAEWEAARAPVGAAS